MQYLQKLIYISRKFLFFSHLLFNSTRIEPRERKNYLERECNIIRCFAIIFSLRTNWEKTTEKCCGRKLRWGREAWICKIVCFERVIWITNHLQSIWLKQQGHYLWLLYFKAFVTCCGKRDQPLLNAVSKRS